MKDEKRLSDKFSVDIFSSRELDVLACVANGHSYKRAALILKISDRMVNAHIRNICGKIGASAKEQVIYFLDKNNALDEIRERFKNREAISDSESTDDELEERDEKTSFLAFSGTKILGAAILICFARFGIYPAFFPKSESRTVVIDGTTVNNETYIDRKSVVNQIDDAFRKSFNVVALVGRGGAGKTTIARRYLQEKGYDFAYEINAETASSAEISTKCLAYSLAKTEEQKNELRHIFGILGSKERGKQTIAFITRAITMRRSLGAVWAMRPNL